LSICVAAFGVFSPLKRQIFAILQTRPSELIGKKADDGFLLIPPFYTAGGDEIRVGRNVFVNQNCTFYDLDGLDIGDDVMIGPNVSIITGAMPWNLHNDTPSQSENPS
jgi:acetyltransferase-like isoleucine patch superfamily enzyme